MRFRSYDTLKLFDAVARQQSITDAAAELNQSKGAVSYQIGKLEADLGFKVFSRAHRRIALTPKGERLWHASQIALGQLDREIADLREERPRRMTVGMLTYFFSRWLSPRLMSFMEAHPGLALRIEPMSDVSGLRTNDVKMAILWGKGDWEGLGSELLFRCPATPTASPKLAERIAEIGLEAAVSTLPLLADSSGSQGWRDWHAKAGYVFNPGRNDLVVADSNIRVQAAIDGQGMALWDALAEPELRSGRLVYVSDVRLEEHGYHLVYAKGAFSDPSLAAFRAWIIQEVGTGEVGQGIAGPVSARAQDRQMC